VPKRLFEFVCPEGHITERLVDSEVRHSVCHCFLESERIVSAPQIKLEGFTGAFPGAYDRWERVRKEKLAVERKQKASRGEE
jgi:hypothetical protein